MIRRTVRHGMVMSSKENIMNSNLSTNSTSSSNNIYLLNPYQATNSDVQLNPFISLSSSANTENSASNSRKRRHHELNNHNSSSSSSNYVLTRDIDIERMRSETSSVCIELRKTIKLIFEKKISDVTHLYGEGMIELIRGMTPHLSLGVGWTVHGLPSHIPQYPVFNNNYNRHCAVGENYRRRRTQLYERPHLAAAASNALYSSHDWKQQTLRTKREIWGKAFTSHCDNYKRKVKTKQRIVASDKMTSRMISAGLQMNIYCALKAVEQRRKNRRELMTSYDWIGTLLRCWEKYIDDTETVVAHGYLVYGMLMEEITGDSRKAREEYIKCIHRIRSLHRVKYARDKRSEIRTFALEDETWDENEINCDKLLQHCASWHWLHFDLNRDQKHRMLDYDPVVFESEVGPFDGCIIETYSRLSCTFDAGSKEKLNCLHKALKLLRNKNGLQLPNVCAIRLIVRYAETFLEKKECEKMDKLYWFYLMKIALSLAKQPQVLSDDEQFDIRSRFLCGCMSNGLSAFIDSMMCAFVTDNLEQTKTTVCARKAIGRLIRVAYTALHYGAVKEAHDLYRSARALMQYCYEGLSDVFEVWWEFNHLCVFAIATITAYACVHGDASYMNVLWDWVSWRNRCTQKMYQIAGDCGANQAAAVNNKYYGYCTQYHENRFNLAFFGAQAMILCTLYSQRNCLPKDLDFERYLETISTLLDQSKSAKLTRYVDVLGYYMKKQFGDLFKWPRTPKNQQNHIIVID
eukprot:449836_1